MANPLTNLLSLKVKFIWNSKCQQAFESLKAAITAYPILRSPDFNKPFILAIDASDTGIGGVLLQREHGTEYPIAYFSKKT